MTDSGSASPSVTQLTVAADVEEQPQGTNVTKPVRPNLAVVSSEGEAKRSSSVDITYLVRALMKYNASDLHLKSDRPPLFRINGRLIPAKMAVMAADQVKALVMSVLNERQRGDLEKNFQVDLSFQVGDLGRFRCNAFYQRGDLAAVIRAIPFRVPALAELGLPTVLKELAKKPRGLLLITGATGSGKSTTLASVIQYLNENSHEHILTIEDPIEFVFKDAKGSVTQREVGSDAVSLHHALMAGLRQDPDVIVIGELRDQETIQGALTAAETGHLVMATLHTSDARSTIDRVVDVFPAEMKNQVRIQLSSSLVGVISQQLIARVDGSGRALACEVLVKSPHVESLILRNELAQIPDAIASSGDYYQMQSMNASLARLVKKGIVALEEALKCTSSPDDLKLMLSGIERGEGYRNNSG